MRNCIVSTLFLAACGFALGQEKGAKPQAAPDYYEFVVLAEARPVLVRLHVHSNGKPIEAAWEAFMKHMFAQFDRNKDGSLNKDEAALVPTAAQILTGGIGQLIGGGTNAIAPLDKLDANKDGKVAFAELCDYYRGNGMAPFQYQIGSGALNPLEQTRAVLGGGRGEPTVDEVNNAVFNRLDANKDGKLTPAELASAPKVLLVLDEDDDEIMTPRELVPDAKTDLNMMITGMAMRGGDSDAKDFSKKSLVPIVSPGVAPAELVKAIQARYGPKNNMPQTKALLREELGIDEALFKKLDANADGALDATELAAFAKRSPDVELTVRLGKIEAGARVQVVAAATGKTKSRASMALLDLGATRIDFKNSDTGDAEEGVDVYGSVIQQQIIALFRQADKNGDGVIDAKEAADNNQFKNLFKAIDRNNDGKVNESEFTAYLDDLKDLQTRAGEACASLVWTDQSRGLFDVLDGDRDGRLSVREIRGASKLIEELGKKDSLAKTDVPKSYQVTVRRGPSETGLGAAAQLVALYRTGYGSNSDLPGVGPQWFRRMDRNRDGDISRKEFLFSDDQFKKLDLNGDGLINVEEAQKAKR